MFLLRSTSFNPLIKISFVIGLLFSSVAFARNLKGGGTIIGDGGSRVGNRPADLFYKKPLRTLRNDFEKVELSELVWSELQDLIEFSREKLGVDFGLDEGQTVQDTFSKIRFMKVNKLSVAESERLDVETGYESVLVTSSYVVEVENEETFEIEDSFEVVELLGKSGEQQRENPSDFFTMAAPDQALQILHELCHLYYPSLDHRVISPFIRNLSLLLSTYREQKKNPENSILLMSPEIRKSSVDLHRLGLRMLKETPIYNKIVIGAPRGGGVVTFIHDTFPFWWSQKGDVLEIPLSFYENLIAGLSLDITSSMTLRLELSPAKDFLIEWNQNFSHWAVLVPDGIFPLATNQENRLKSLGEHPFTIALPMGTPLSGTQIRRAKISLKLIGEVSSSFEVRILPCQNNVFFNLHKNNRLENVNLTCRGSQNQLKNINSWIYNWDISGNGNRWENLVLRNFGNYRGTYILGSQTQVTNSYLAMEGSFSENQVSIPDMSVIEDSLLAFLKFPKRIEMSGSLVINSDFSKLEFVSVIGRSQLKEKEHGQREALGPNGWRIFLSDESSKSYSTNIQNVTFADGKMLSIEHSKLEMIEFVNLPKALTARNLNIEAKNHYLLRRINTQEESDPQKWGPHK